MIEYIGNFIKSKVNKKPQFYFESKDLFDKNGNFILSFKTGFLIDCILCILSVYTTEINLDKLRLELQYSCVYIQRPDLKNVILQLKREGVICLNALIN